MEEPLGIDNKNQKMERCNNKKQGSDKLDIFLEKFHQDYTSKKIRLPKYQAYLAWKFEKAPLPNLQEIKKMIRQVSDDINKYDSLYPEAASYVEPFLNDDPWQNYILYKKDKFIVSYLNYIENELIHIQKSSLL